MQALGQDLRDLLGLFEQHGVRYLIVGGFAVGAHGFPRYTKDLDVWLECTTENARRVLAALAEFGFGSLELCEQDLATPDLVIQLGYEPNRVDLLTGLTGVVFEDAYPKRVNAAVDGLMLPIIDRESLARNKRAFGHAQDLVDAEDLER